MYAEVAVYQANVRQTFHYEIPDGLPVRAGQLVEVSFRTARSQGIVLELSENSPVARAKPILDILIEEPVVTPPQIDLARWMADHTLTPVSACLWLSLRPAGPGHVPRHDPTASAPAPHLGRRGPAAGTRPGPRPLSRGQSRAREEARWLC